MKKVLFVLSAAIFFASCKKDSSVGPDPTPGVTKKLVKATYVYNSDPAETETYTYDGQGRVSTITEDTRNETFDYTSATSLLVTQRKSSDNSLMQTKECTLNDKGYITKITFKNPAGTITYFYEYTYNADGYMTKVKGSNASGSNYYEVEFVIVDGNMVSSKAYFDGVFTYNREYKADKTKMNKAVFDYNAYWQGTKMFGKKPTNLTIEYKEITVSGTVNWHTKTSYEMDANGYPVKLTTDNILTGAKAVNTYTFQ